MRHALLTLILLNPLSNPGIAFETPEEELFFIPPGFEKPGEAKECDLDNAGILQIEVTESHEQTPCRINVIGSDGNFYQPSKNRLTPFAMTGEWPKSGKGNRREKAPFRYIGHFFYSSGESEVRVPPGKIRIEVFKGFEYRPISSEILVQAGETKTVKLPLSRNPLFESDGFVNGDPHLHFQRMNDEDEDQIFSLMQAEDIGYGSILAYNEPAGPYNGLMSRMDSPQRNLGPESISNRWRYQLMSGQEYRTSAFGHLNLHGRDELVFPGQAFNADHGPVYAKVGEETQKQGGIAIYAHGGYAQEIYADIVNGSVNAVELLQFGVYRGIALEDWYHILNSGYRFPITGASDYPACRFLGDCRTYVSIDPEKSSKRNSRSSEPAGERFPSFPEWLEGVAAGRSFVTTGPLLYLQVEGNSPGAILREKLEPGKKKKLKIQIRLISEVTPVSKVQLIANGKPILKLEVPKEKQLGKIWETTEELEIEHSTWIAARAYSTRSSLDKTGQPIELPDAESHTNPVYVLVNNRAVYVPESLDVWVSKIEKQVQFHEKRDFPDKRGVLEFFQSAKERLLQIKESKGLPAGPVTEKGSLEKKTAKPPLRDLESDGSIPNPTDEELREFLKPVPPPSPEELMASIETNDDLQIELVAAEPDVFDPIAGAFDAEGNLFVCEMRDYPYKPADSSPPFGSIRCLRDIDGDGRFETSTIFASGLLWPAGVAPWKGGIFVAACPDVWYFRDTDGDYIADEKTKIFSGFGTENQQAMVNNFTFGPDFKIYGSTAGNGGVVSRADNGNSGAVSLNGRDFRFDPRTLKLETITGTIQFGNTFDAWGNRFLCSESQPLHHVVLPQEYLDRNPFLIVPQAIVNIAPGPVPIYRSSPIERWRHLRSSRRIAKKERASTAPGASHSVIDAAAGVTVYKGETLPSRYWGNVFIADGQNNLIHRRKLVPDGVTFQSKRLDENREVVRSSNIWFRPVNFINGPDGCLYVLDMSREVLETIHIPIDVAKHLDLTSGRNYGRIFRLAPKGHKPSGFENLNELKDDELVQRIESPNSWVRETAARLLFERESSSVTKLLEKQISHQRPETRLQALWLLHHLGGLNESLSLASLRDPHPRVRENAVKISEQKLTSSPAMLGALERLCADPDPRVRFQTAFSIGESQSPENARLLAGLLKQDSDQWLKIAALSSMAGSSSDLWSLVEKDPEWKDQPGGRELLLTLASLIASGGSDAEVIDLLEQTLSEETQSGDLILRSAANGLRSRGLKLPVDRLSEESKARLKEIEKASIQTINNPDSSVQLVVSALDRLTWFPITNSTRSILEASLSQERAPEVQIAAIRAISFFADQSLSGSLIQHWRHLPGEARTEAVRAMLSRPETAVELLQAGINQKIELQLIDSTQRQILLHHRDPKVRNLAQKALQSIEETPRAEVVAKYQKALDLEGNPERGRALYVKNCSVCHRLGKEGNQVGPNLASSQVREPEALLTHILDPNRYVLPNYVVYVIEDQQGATHSGIISAQTATSITLKRDKDLTTSILRSSIVDISSTGKSLMPEGLEGEINLSQMADLMSFLMQEQSISAEEIDPETRDFGTLPGLIEPKTRKP